MNSKAHWIKTGYRLFALNGVDSIKVEALARIVGVSKSSFYHHFAGLDIFIDALLDEHLQQAAVMAEKERNAANIHPELIEVLVEHKLDLLFNRQLRIHQDVPRYREVLLQSNSMVGNEFIRIWADDLQLNLHQRQLMALFELALENFFLQINEANLNGSWLEAYFANLKRIARQFV